MFRRRLLRTSALSVCTSMLGPAGMAQLATRVRAPLTSTRQTRQAPVGVQPLRWQRVGIFTPLAWATSRMVWPGVKGTKAPLRERVGRLLSMVWFPFDLGMPGGAATRWRSDSSAKGMSTRLVRWVLSLCGWESWRKRRGAGFPVYLTRVVSEAGVQVKPKDRGMVSRLGFGTLMVRNY